MRQPFNYWISIPTRFSDMDPQNHVNNVSYFEFLETARMAFLRELGLMEFKIPGKEGPVVVSQTCNYKKQVVHPSTIEVGVRVTKVKNRSLTVSYALYLEGEDDLVLDGHTTLAWTDYQIKKSIPIPQALRQRIQDYEDQQTPAP